MSTLPAASRAALHTLFTRAAVVALPVVLAACASKPVEPPPPPPAPPVAAPAPAPAPAPVAAPAPAPLPEYLDPNNPLSQKRSVYFDFDQSTFHAEDKSVIELHGGYLSKHPDLHVRVEGNTDERGGTEYNLALGQRRAESVKSALKILGVQDGQVEAVSFGKERPKAPGHDEASWAQNRRADIAYPAAR
jgi:peptidoglycan-associated lipoprotein